MNESCKQDPNGFLLQGQLSRMWYLHTKYNYIDPTGFVSLSWALDIFWAVTGTISMYIGFTMLLHKKFDRHPYRLYAWEILAYSAMSLQFK